MKLPIACLLFTLVCLPVFATDWVEHEGIKKAFAEAGATGTFVAFEVSGDRFTGHDEKRANTRFVPASTFKIANSLIGLSAGAVKSVDEVLPYGGKPQPFDTWEHDMSLREAIKISNVPIYQELARRIGLEKMQAGVEKLDYGNRKIGEVVDRFWLDGPLQISAVEQVKFLARLAQRELPVSKEVQEAVRGIVKLESGEGWTLYGKTGWEKAPGAGIGWWVGWVEKDGRIHAFALNMDMKTSGDAATRLAIGRRALAELGLLPVSK